MTIAISDVGFVKKGWGYEKILHSTDKFCVKHLVFEKKGAKCSLHYHTQKYEEWTVIEGAFKILWETVDGEKKITQHEKGDVIKVPRRLAHQMMALYENSTLLEVSTQDDPNDSVRIAPGDSQNATL